MLVRRSSTIALSLLMLLALLPAAAAQAAVTLPLYRAQLIAANSVPTAINSAGETVGWITVDGVNKPFIYSGGALTILPTPAGRPIGIARDINASGVVVGNAQTSTSDEPGHAMRWSRNSSGTWAVQDLGTLPTDTASDARGINDLGRIVGRSNGGSELFNHGFTWTAAGGMRQLAATQQTFSAYDVNSSGMVVGNGYSSALMVDTTSGAVTNLGAGGYGYSWVQAINDAGQIAGTLTSASGNSERLARYTPGSGWKVLGGLGEHNTSWGMNSAGTVVGEGWARLGESPYRRGVVYLDAFGGLLYVDDLLESGSGWSVYYAFDINDSGQIVGAARNSVTGVFGGLLLTPVGTLPVPTAPTNLTATVFAAQTIDEQNRIDLRWLDTSSYETSFELQRREVTATGTVLVPYAQLTMAGRNITAYSDMAMGLGSYYQYRVRAVGFAGASAWSNVAAARAPTSTPERVPPVVSFVSPVDGATVAGRVAVSIRATDNVGVVRVEFLSDAGLVGVCSGTPPTYKCTWDSRKTWNGAHVLYARAWDAVGNSSQAAITVYVKNRR